MRQHRNSTKKDGRHRLVIEQLDERVMLDAAGLLAPAMELSLLDSGGDSEVATRNEVIFVDMSVEDANSIIEELRLQGARHSRDVIPIYRDHDGIQQIAEAVAGRSGIDAIHIVSHGQDAILQLGDSQVGVSDLRSTYAEALKTIWDSLS
jgi:hypothetical protein